MMIKANRIRSSSGARALARHLLNGSDNESITVVQGTAADLDDAVADARKFGRVYAVRHFIVAPQFDIDRDQLGQCVAGLAAEFGFDPAAAFIVEHQKARAVDGVSDHHWHIVLPEVDPQTGRVLSSAHNHARHEKVSRCLEVAFGHPIVPGRHDKAVIAALRAAGNHAVADQVAEPLTAGKRPREAFTTTDHQAAKRQGADLALLKAHVGAAWVASSSGDDFAEALAEHGMTVAPGNKENVWVIRTTEGVFLGSGHRLVRARRDEFTRKMETRHGDDTTERSTDNPQRHHQDQGRRRNHSSAGENRGGADGGGAGQFPDHRDRTAGDDRQRRGRNPEVGGGVASPLGRTGHRGDVAPGAERGLIVAFGNAAKALGQLHLVHIGQPFIARANSHLDQAERAAQAELAGAQIVPLPSRVALDSAISYERAAGARLDGLWKERRALEALPDPKPSGMVSRLFARGDGTGETAGGEAAKTLAQVMGRLAAAEREWLTAKAGVGRAEQAYRAVEAAQRSQTEQLASVARATIAQVRTSRRIVHLYPRLAYGGPSFVHSVGRQVERRRYLLNPQARNIWGLPIEP